MPVKPKTNGVHHVGLTVPNLAVTLTFFTDVLGYQTVGEIPDYPAVFLSDGTTMITLWQVKDIENAVPFDRHNVVGLHHLALTVDSIDFLHELHHTLIQHNTLDVEFAPEPLGDGPTHHMMCFIPGGIRLEFIAPGT